MVEYSNIYHRTKVGAGFFLAATANFSDQHLQTDLVQDGIGTVNGVMFALHVDAYSAGNVSFTLEEADDDGTGSPGTFTAVANDEMVPVGGMPDVVSDGINRLGYAGKKRYVRVRVIGTNTPVMNIFGNILLTNFQNQPAPDQTQTVVV